MSIAPPSDIIFDVAQAADPTRRAAAMSRLAQTAAQGGVPATDFSTTFAGTKPAIGSLSSASLPLSPLTGSGHDQVSTGHSSVYQKFEAMLLQNFVSEILPKDTTLYGDAASADFGRSMMAEKVADELARSGRIGIAASIERAETASHSADLPPAKAPEGGAS